VTRLEGRAAAVTGAARGIGRAIADRLASEGAAVVGVDRDASTLEATIKVAFLASDDGEYVSGDVIHVTGDVIHVTGGRY
jgi:3-oxoacyl-[acyl-carrier protein] reductase